MKYYVYKVQKVNCYHNKATKLDYDYEKDFYTLAKLRQYVINDYYVSDSMLKPNEVYFNGDLIKIIEIVTEFEGDAITVIPYNK